MKLLELFSYNFRQCKPKTISTVIVLILSFAVISGCKDKEEHIAVAFKTEYIDIPQTHIDGIVFPAKQNEAKRAGFNKCEVDNLNNISGETSYKCFLNRKIKFEGDEFSVAFIELNKINNLLEVKSEVELIHPPALPMDEGYSFHSIHILTNNELDQKCMKENSLESILPKNIGCSSGEVFLKKLTVQGWIKDCGNNNDSIQCNYYPKVGSYRLVARNQSFTIPVNNAPQLHLELEPLSPAKFKLLYNRISYENELKNNKKQTEQNFIDSMQN